MKTFYTDGKIEVMMVLEQVSLFLNYIYFPLSFLSIIIIIIRSFPRIVISIRVIDNQYITNC